VKGSSGVQSEILNDSYLGMPTLVGRSPTSSFNFLYDMIWKHINGVVDRHMSRVGVVGMTIWVGQGQSHLPADVPGITTALG
jgi:hypothetical protein